MLDREALIGQPVDRTYGRLIAVADVIVRRVAVGATVATSLLICVLLMRNLLGLLLGAIRRLLASRARRARGNPWCAPLPTGCGFQYPGSTEWGV